MKKILLLTTFFAGSLLITASAQAQFQAGINIDVQPAWGPSGYDYAENYYLPDVEAYYNVPSHQFIYNDGGNWVYASSLPGRCGNYDLYGGYKVVINERSPWLHFNDHRNLYAGYRYRHDQLAIRDGRSYERGGYGRGQMAYGGRNWGYGQRENYGGQERGRANNRGGDYNNRRYNNRDDRGRGRW